MIDAFFLAGRGFLVFELWGTSLHSLLHQGAVVPSHTQELTRQCLEGLQQLKTIFFVAMNSKQQASPTAPNQAAMN